MKSKTSFFNPTLYWNCWRRFWPLALAVLAVVLYLPGMQLFGILRDTARWSSVAVMRLSGLYAIYDVDLIMTVLMTGASFLSAALVFRHLHSRRAIEFYHGLPVTRLAQYITGFLGALSLIAVPMLLGILLCMLEAAVLNGGAVTVLALLRLFLAGMAGLAVFTAMAVIACVLAGQTFGAFLIYAGMNCAAMVLIDGLSELGELVMPGVVLYQTLDKLGLWLTPVIHLARSVAPRNELLPAEMLAPGAGTPGGSELLNIPVGFSGIPVLAAYFLAGLSIAALGAWLYRIRPSETAGEMISFGPVRTVSKIFGALMVMVAGSLLVLCTGIFQGQSIPFGAVVISVLGFAALGWFMAEMIVRKSLRVFRLVQLRSCGVLLAVLLVLLLAGKTDLLGRTRYVPEPAKVREVTVNYQFVQPVTMDPQDAAELHALTLDHKDLLGNNSYFTSSRTLEFQYTLQNGRTLTRTYRVRTDYDAEDRETPNSLSAAVYEMFSRPDYNYQACFGQTRGQVTEETLTYTELTSYLLVTESTAEEWEERYLLTGLSQGNRSFSTREGMALYEAVCRDLEAGRVGPGGFGADGLGLLFFTWYEEPYHQGSGSYSVYAEQVPMHSGEVNLNRNMTETLRVLGSMGITVSEY